MCDRGTRDRAALVHMENLINQICSSVCSHCLSLKHSLTDILGARFDELPLWQFFSNLSVKTNIFLYCLSCEQQLFKASDFSFLLSQQFPLNIKSHSVHLHLMLNSHCIYIYCMSLGSACLLTHSDNTYPRGNTIIYH